MSNRIMWRWFCPGCGKHETRPCDEEGEVRCSECDAQMTWEANVLEPEPTALAKSDLPSLDNLKCLDMLAKVNLYVKDGEEFPPLMEQIEKIEDCGEDWNKVKEWDRIKPYVERMERDTERQKALERLQRAGIVDENGELAEEYRTEEEPVKNSNGILKLVEPFIRQAAHSAHNLLRFHPLPGDPEHDQLKEITSCLERIAVELKNK